MSGVVIANPFGPTTPPPQPAAPHNPFAAQSAFVAPYGVPANQLPPQADPYLAGSAAHQSADIIDAQFTVVPPPQPVLAPQLPVPPPANLSGDALLTEAELTAEYIRLRDEKKVVADRQAEELAPYRDRMEVIEKTMLARLNSSGVESVRTTMGTAFKKLTTRFNVEDGEALMSWIQANGQQDMLTRAVKQDAIREYLDNTGTLPPGIGVFSEYGVQFRK